MRDLALDTSPEGFISTNVEDRPGRKALFTSLLSHPDSFILGAFEGFSLVGVVQFERYDRIKLHHKGAIKGMFVHPEMAGRGIGTLLLKTALDKISQIEGVIHVTLYVMAGNEAAISLYKKMGFEVYGVEKEAIQVNRKMLDLLLMSRKIN